MTRREWLRALAGLSAAALAPPARAEERHVVGLVTPPGGEAFVAGVELGLADGNALAGFFAKRLEVVRETATGGGAAGAGERLVREKRVMALVGGADDEAADALRDVAAGADVLFFNVGAAGDGLRAGRCHRHTFHVAPSRAMGLDALARVLIDDRRLPRWAVVAPDATAPAVEAVRRAVGRRGGSVVAVEATGGPSPSWVFARLGAAGPDVVFVALAEDALAEAVRRARAAGLTATLAGIGHPALARDEATGVWVSGWHRELEQFSARELNARFRRRFGRSMTGDSWAAWAALKMLAEAVVRAQAADAPALIRYFEAAPRFDGHKGEPLTFRAWDHQLSQPLYILGPRKPEDMDERRGPLAVIRRMPPPGVELEAVGVGKGETQCRL